LADVHPEAIEVERMQLTVFADGGKRLLLDRCRAKLNALEYTRVEDIYASVDAVAHELDWFLDEPINPRWMVGFVHDHTVFGRLLDFRHHDSTLLSVRFMEFAQLLERVVADHVRVEYEERRVILAEDTFCELERTSGAKGFGLHGELDLNVVLFLVL